MEYSEAYNLIQETYVLTEKEKSLLLKKFKMQDQKIIQMLVDFRINRNVQSFYMKLRQENMLSIQETYNEFMELYSPKKINENSVRSSSPISYQTQNPNFQISRADKIAQSPRKNDFFDVQLTEILSQIPLHNIEIVTLLQSLCGKKIFLFFFCLKIFSSQKNYVFSFFKNFSEISDFF